MGEEKTPEAIVEELRAQYGDDIVHAKTKLGLIALRAPDEAEYRRFQDKVTDGKGTAAMREMVNCCRIYPEPEAFAAVLAKKPALYPALATALNDVAGGDIEVVAGK